MNSTQRWRTTITSLRTWTNSLACDFMSFDHLITKLSQFSDKLFDEVLGRHLRIDWTSISLWTSIRCSNRRWELRLILVFYCKRNWTSRIHRDCVGLQFTNQQLRQICLLWLMFSDFGITGTNPARRMRFVKTSHAKFSVVLFIECGKTLSIGSTVSDSPNLQNAGILLLDEELLTTQISDFWWI